MKLLDLKESLFKLGISQLSNLVGDALIEQSTGRITSHDLVDILFLNYGNQILSQKQIRHELISILQEDHINYLSQKQNLEEAVKEIYNHPWSRSNKISMRWIEVFGLDDQYLPPVKKVLNSIKKIEPEKILYDYQKKIKDRLVKTLISGEKKVLVKMPTGSGKTRTAIEALIDYWRFNSKNGDILVWLANQEELCQQACDSFEEFWKIRGDRSLNIYKFWGNHKLKTEDIKDGGIIIAGFDKFHSARLKPTAESSLLTSNIRSRTRLILIDEAHMSIAPTYKDTIEFLYVEDYCKIIGLTATPFRSDIGESIELSAYFNKKIITLTDENGNDMDDPMLYLQDRNYLSKVSRRVVKSNAAVNFTKAEIKYLIMNLKLPEHKISELTSNQVRNQLILSEIFDLVQAGEHIIVFANSVEHANILSVGLKSLSIKAQYIDGKTPTAQRQERITQFIKKDINVLINFGVLTTGFDAPEISAVVITRPTFSPVLYSQMIGRGMRGKKLGGTKNCILVDVDDNLFKYPDESSLFNVSEIFWGK